MRKPDLKLPRRLDARETLRRLIHEEYASRAFHAQVVEAFGTRAPFPAALKDCERRIRQCAAQFERIGLPRPPDPFAWKRAGIAASWRENCERALRGEAAKVMRLQALLAVAAGSGVEPFVMRLCDESVRTTIPAFQRALADAIERERMHAERGVPPEAAHVRHGPLGDFLEQAFSLLSSQHGAFGALGPLVRNTEPALLGGLAAGAAAVWVARQSKRRNRKED